QPGLHVERDDARAEEVRAGPMSPVLVQERHADGDVRESQVGIRGVRRPRVVLAYALGTDLRAVRPGVRAVLTGLRHEVELPELLAGVDVETADPTGIVADANGIVAVHVRVPDDYHVGRA